MHSVRAWILAMMWMAGILYTSSLGQAVTPVGGFAQMIVAKLGHVTEYAILGGLLWMGVRGEGPTNLALRWAMLSVLLIGAAFASCDELRQSFVPGREPRVSDVLLDTLSVVTGALATSKLVRAEDTSQITPADGLEW